MGRIISELLHDFARRMLSRWRRETVQVHLRRNENVNHHFWLRSSITRWPEVALVLALCLGLVSTPVTAQEKGGEDEAGPYDVVHNWPQRFASPGYSQGSQSGVFAESPNRIFMLNRGELKLPDKLPDNCNTALADQCHYNGSWGSLGVKAPAPKPEVRNCIVVADASGKILEIWTQWDHLFLGGRGPHKVKISPYDPERHVWVVDDSRHQIFEFTNDGKQLVMTLGEAGVPGDDNTHFDRPTDIAFLSDGTFFISDGYKNTRVMKFDKTGKFLMTWGKPGKGPGEFNLPHAIETDRNHHVYVADRENHRIQVFDENGKFLDQWPNIRSPYHMMMSADQHLWVSDGLINRFLKYDLDGKLLSSWGIYGQFPGAIWAVHQFSVDQEGNVYAAETFGGRTQKFRPSPKSDPSSLIGPPVPLMGKDRD